MKSERLGHSSSSRGGLSGPNDDSSVVSLKALVAEAEPTLSAARATSLEDSGLIDLKKLMANAPSSDALPPVLAPSEAGLFDVPEITLTSHVAGVADAANEALAKDSVGWAKWLGAVTLVVLAGVGTLSILHARKAHVSDIRSGVVAAAPVTPTAPNEFVEAHPPLEAAPAVPSVPPTVKEAATETQAPATTNRRSRKAAVQTPSRDQARQEPTTPKVHQPSPAPCDLMCEIQRAARKKQ